MRPAMKKFAIAAVTAAGIAAAVATPADARWRGGGWGFGPAFVGGLALGAIAAGPAYGYYGYPGYYAYGAGGCYVRRQWIDTPYGPRVRRVRVCY